MSQANLNDLDSIEQAYPRQAYDEDAGTSSRATTEIFHGVRITSGPEKDGSFEIVRASRQVGEIDPESDTVFLFPELVPELDAMRRTGSAYGSADPEPDVLSRLDVNYRAFIVRIGETARTVTFKSAIGRGEERLSGFHGG